MTPWAWWVGTMDGVSDGVYDVAECTSRADAIREGCREVGAGAQFHIIEARSSTARRSWDDEAPIPFVMTRKHEIIHAGPFFAEPDCADVKDPRP